MKRDALDKSPFSFAGVQGVLPPAQQKALPDGDRKENLRADVLGQCGAGGKHRYGNEIKQDYKSLHGGSDGAL